MLPDGAKWLYSLFSVDRGELVCLVCGSAEGQKKSHTEVWRGCYMRHLRPFCHRPVILPGVPFLLLEVVISMGMESSGTLALGWVYLK